MLTPYEVQQIIEDFGVTLEPDGDWPPILHLYKNHECAIMFLDLMEDDQQKRLCAQVIYKSIQVTNPDWVWFTATAWQSPPERGEGLTKDDVIKAMREGVIPRPADDPDRVEIVMALVVDKECQSNFMCGRLVRYPDRPPEIAEWEEHIDNKPLEGNFGEAIAKGFDDADLDGDLRSLQELKHKEE